MESICLETYYTYTKVKLYMEACCADDQAKKMVRLLVGVICTIFMYVGYVSDTLKPCCTIPMRFECVVREM